METIHESVSKSIAPETEAKRVEAKPAFASYQIEFLLDEIAFLRDELKRCPRYPAIDFLHLHMLQFYWTVTRAFGRAFYRLFPSIQTQKRPVRRPRPQLEKEHVKWVDDGRRVLIDMTVTHREDVKTGIQRVVREVVQASIESGEALPVIIEDGRLRSYFIHPDLPDVIEVRAGDRLLLLDNSWNYAAEYRSMLDEVVRRGGFIIGFYYDIIPLLYPGFFSSEVNGIFRDWFYTSLPYFSAIGTISRSVALDISQYISEGNLPHRSALRVGWFHLGADFDSNAGSASESVLALADGKPFFLAVGTLEPRKNHVAILHAFERLWSLGVDVCCVFVGRRGWLTDAMCSRLLRHPEFGHRFFWFETCSDADLRHLYRHATGLIQASLAEGFGLPLVEAAHFGTPVIASDIPVFHEIGGSSCAYFDPLDPEALAAHIVESLKTPRSAPAIELLSWVDATANLLRLIKEESYEFTVPDTKNPQS